MRILLVGASPSGSPELVARLATTHDRLIAVDGGGALCLQAGVTPARLIGDLDSIADSTIQQLANMGVPFDRYPAEKDQTDLVLALASAQADGATAVTLTGVLGARLDHTLAALGAVGAAAALRPTIRETDATAIVLSEHGTRSCGVRGTGATFSAIALDGVGEISIRGAHWPLDHAIVDALSGLGVSNLVADGRAVITAHAGCIAVIAPSIDGVIADLEYDD